MLSKKDTIEVIGTYGRNACFADTARCWLRSPTGPHDDGVVDVGRIEQSPAVDLRLRRSINDDFNLSAEISNLIDGRRDLLLDLHELAQPAGFC